MAAMATSRGWVDIVALAVGIDENDAALRA